MAGRPRHIFGRSFPGHPALGVGAVALLLAVSAPHALAVETTSSTRLEEAISARSKGDTDRAVVILKDLLQRAPDDLPARLLLGDIYLQQAAPLAAEKELKVARSLGANDTRFHALMAEALILQAKFADALAEVGGPEPRGDDTLDILLMRGQALAGLDRMDDSIIAYRRAVAMAPNSPEAMTGLARALVKAGKLDEAQTHLDKLLARTPGYLDGWIARGELAQARGDIQSAIGAYSTAAEIAPDNMQVRMYRAAANLDMNQLDAALKDIDAILDEVDYEPQALYLKSQILQRQGKEDEAHKALERAGDLLNNANQDLLASFPAMLRLAGIVDAALERNIRAIDFFDKYLLRYPRDEVSLRWRAALALRQNEPAQAAPFLETLLKDHPDDAAALNLMGIVQIRLHRFDRALTYFQKAAEQAPEDNALARDIGASYLELGDMESAISALSDAVKREPDNVASVVMLLLAYVRDDNPQAARQVWETASADWRTTPLARQLSAAIYVAQGDFDGARDELRKALAQDKEFAPARLALARVELQTGHLEAAGQLYRQALDANADNPVAIDGLAQTALARRDYAEAVTWYRKAVALAPESGTATRALMDAMLRKGDRQDAEALGAEFLRRHPGSTPVLSAYGEILNDSGRASQTVDLYRAALSTSTADPRYYIGLARAQLIAGDGTSALETFQRGTKVFPASARLYRAYVLTALRRGALQQARDAADQFYARLPQNPVALELKGAVLMAGRDFQGAYDFYNTVAEGDLSSAVVTGRFNAGMALGTGKAELPRLETWVKAHPGDTDAKAVLAGAYQAFGDTQAALREYEELRPRLPQHAGLLNNLAWLYYVTDNDKALETAALAYELAPDNANTADTYGWILTESGDAEKALPLLRKARSLNASEPIIQYHIGVALSALGRTGEARRELESALKAGKPFDGADRARALLQQIAADSP